jgi:hypothetical protein
MRRLSGASAPKRKVCGGSATVNGENLDIFDGRGRYSRPAQQPKSAKPAGTMLTANFASAPLIAKITTLVVAAVSRLLTV